MFSKEQVFGGLIKSGWEGDLELTGQFITSRLVVLLLKARYSLVNAVDYTMYHTDSQAYLRLIYNIYLT